MKSLPPIAFYDALMKSEDDAAQSFAAKLDNFQVFDFGDVDCVVSIWEPATRMLNYQLWRDKLLRLPFRHSCFRFRLHQRVIYMLLIEDAQVVVEDSPGNGSHTAMLLLLQRGDRVALDMLIWFAIEGENMSLGAQAYTKVANESAETFRSVTSSMARLAIDLSMLLNTKGVPRRYEPVQPRLNAKRAKNGKPPLTAVTYIDLRKVSVQGHSSAGGGEKSMHLRRGHIRHFTDGSTTWVRDCIIKADGELKKRERYQLRNPS